MTEQTLFIVKPDGVERKLVGDIVSRFEHKGFNILKLKMFTFTKQMAEEFYSAHNTKPFFGELVSFITSGSVVAAIIEGNNAIATTRLLEELRQAGFHLVLVQVGGHPPIHVPPAGPAAGKVISWSRIHH